MAAEVLSLGYYISGLLGSLGLSGFGVDYFLLFIDFIMVSWYGVNVAVWASLYSTFVE